MTINTRMAVRVAVGSATVGSLLGWCGNHYYESWKLPSVEARQEIPHKPELPIEHSTSAVRPNRISEIMKYGFPSLVNIKSYQDFVLSYDQRNRVANWVFEHITKESCRHNPEVDRSHCEFRPDETVHEYFRSTNEDYLKSGFDRGHLAAAGNHKVNQKLCNETFVLSNIAPQVGAGFNRHSWNRLEKYVRKLTHRYENVYVCTGPLYLPRKEPDGKLYVRYQVIGNNHVAVPTHFFKVVFAETSNKELFIEAFTMPNQPIPDDTPLHKFLVTVESIERAAGLLFLNKGLVERLSKLPSGRMLGG